MAGKFRKRWAESHAKSQRGTEESPLVKAALMHPDSWAAIRLTLIVAAISVPLNLLFGLAASWAIAKFEFRGKSLLITLIDLPFSVSPVVAGLMFIVLFGLQI